MEKKSVMIFGERKIKVITVCFLYIITALFGALLIFEPPITIIIGTGLILSFIIIFGVHIMICTKRKLIIANLFFGICSLVLSLSLLGIIIYNYSMVNFLYIFLQILVFIAMALILWIFFYKNNYLNYKNKIENKRSSGYAFIGLALGNILYKRILSKFSDDSQFVVFTICCLFIALLCLILGVFFVHKYYRLSSREKSFYLIYYDNNIY